ncbi:MAG TPA: hypothetical protein VFQ38_03045 [Longimicrobiales bacterium]|nr:hypothetical protein [Longimicrobiales bacterium]
MIPETRCPARRPTRAAIGRCAGAAALLLATGAPLVAQRELPSVSQLVDSAAVADSAGAFVTRRTVVSLAFDSTGAADWSRVVEPRDAGAAERRLEALLMDRLRPQEPKRTTYLRLEVEPGPPARLRVRSSDYRKPVLTDRGFVAQRLVDAVRRTGLSPTKVALRVLVDENGHVARTQVRNAGSMSVTELEDIARSMAFQPGAVDGRPVPLWIEIPLRIERRRF